MLIFGHMKLAVTWVICALSIVATARAADSVAATNSAPAAVAGTDESLEAVVPGDHFTNTVGMELVKVGGFWAGKYEVRQKEYQKVTGTNPSAFGGDQRPVDSVSWNGAMDFCARLTAEELKRKSLPAGYYYTLPTESEWESLLADASLKDAVTSQGARRAGTAPVGSLGTNSLGLYDMRGNVMEFCLGDTGKPYRVLRGASWQDWIEINLRPDFRNYCKPDDKQNTFGFRVLLKKP
jgi:formylglycine-generating enzyme required for sulfatase activity